MTDLPAEAIELLDAMAKRLEQEITWHVITGTESRRQWIARAKEVVEAAKARAA